MCFDFSDPGGVEGSRGTTGGNTGGNDTPGVMPGVIVSPRSLGVFPWGVALFS